MCRIQKWITYVKMEGGSAIIQGLAPLNYVILKEKLSTDSLRALAYRKGREPSSHYVSLVNFGLTNPNFMSFLGGGEGGIGTVWAYISEAPSKPVECQENKHSM